MNEAKKSTSGSVLSGEPSNQDDKHRASLSQRQAGSSSIGAEDRQGSAFTHPRFDPLIKSAEDGVADQGRFPRLRLRPACSNSLTSLGPSAALGNAGGEP